MTKKKKDAKRALLHRLLDDVCNADDAYFKCDDDDTDSALDALQDAVDDFAFALGTAPYEMFNQFPLSDDPRWDTHFECGTVNPVADVDARVKEIEEEVKQTLMEALEQTLSALGTMHMRARMAKTVRRNRRKS